MQDYRRQIAYLYAYEYGRQTKSTGFVKLEVRGESCRLGIHLKSFCRQGEMPGKAYIFFGRRGYMVGLCLGELKAQNGILKWRGTVDTDNILGKRVGISETGGVWINRPEERNYVARWDDGPVNISRLIPYPPGGEKCIGCPRLGSCERSAT